MKFKELDVWNHAVNLAIKVYEVTGQFPDAERYGLSAQMRSAAVSIPSNIAEGEGRGTPRDHLRFLANARGSLYELDTQIVICNRLGWLADDLTADIDRATKLINGTIRAIDRTARKRD